MTKGTSVCVAKQNVVAHKIMSQKRTGKRKPNRKSFFVTVEKTQRRKIKTRRKRCILSVVDEQKLIEGLLPTPNSGERKVVVVEVPEEVDMENYCQECGVAMGTMNPRQLCGKWRCNGYGFFK